MKKIVVAMLLILPLIIMASVLLATSIIATEAYIAVESVLLSVDTNETIELGLSEGSYQLIATVYPTGAKGKDLIWSIENVQVFGEDTDKPVEITQDGLVKFHTYCTFDVVVTTVEGNKSARCNFYIKSDKAERVEIVTDSDTVRTGESKLLGLLFTPVDAEVSEVHWSSSAPDVLSVDRNGIVTAHKEGPAVITVNTLLPDSTTGVTATKNFSVTKGVTKFGTEFSVAAASFLVADILPNGTVTVLSGGTLSEGRLTFTEKTAVLSVDGEEITVHRCGEGDIGILHKNLLAGKTLRVGKLPVYLDAHYLDVFETAVPNVNYLGVNNAGIVAVDGATGKVTPLAKGQVTVSVLAANGKSDSMDFSVIAPVKYIRLSSVDGDDKKGIALETVHGNSTVAGGGYAANFIDLAIQYPKSPDYDDFEYSVDLSEYAYFSGTKLYFKDNIQEEVTLTVTVKAKYSAYESMDVTAKRHIKVVNGASVASYEELKKAAADGRNVALRGNILFPSNGGLTLLADFYGNGFMLDAIPMTKGNITPVVTVMASDVKISNAHIRADDAAKINEANGMSGIVLMVGEKDGATLDGIVVEYSILENCYHTIETHNATVLVNGSILRNASNFGINLLSQLRSDGKTDSTDFTINNSVITNIVAPAFGISATDSLRNGKPLDNQSKFTQTGFLDVYNWQDVLTGRMLNRDFIPGDPAMNSTLRSLVSNVLGDEIKKSDYDTIRYTYDGDNYLHLGGITAGAMHENTSVLTFEDERFITFELSILQTNGLLKAFKLKPIVMYCYTVDAEITPKSTFSENARLYQRLRGEG